jgi:hypothetical protein
VWTGKGLGWKGVDRLRDKILIGCRLGFCRERSRIRDVLLKIGINT